MSKKLAAAEASLDTLRDAGRWEDVARALKILEKQTEGQTSSAHPTSAFALAYRLTINGEIAAHRGRFEDARKLFLRALAAAPEYVDALVSLALLHIEWGSWSSAHENLAGALMRRRARRLPELSRLVQNWRRGGGAGPSVTAQRSNPTASEPSEAPADAAPTALGFADSDVVELLTRARAVSIDGVEHATPYRLLLRCRGLLLLCKLHEQQGLRVPAGDPAHSSSSSAAAASAAAAPSAAVRALLGALACCDEAWRVAAHYGRARFGIGRGVGPQAAPPSSPPESLPFRVSSSVSFAARPGGLPPLVTAAAFLASPEVCAVVDQSSAPQLASPAASSLPAYAPGNVWLGGPSSTPAMPLPGSLAPLRGRAGDFMLLPAALTIGGGAADAPSAGPAVPPSAMAAAAVAAAQRGGGGGPELLGSIEPRCREVIAECICRMPALLHRLGDLGAARRAYTACLDWHGPVAQVSLPAARAALADGLLALLCEGAEAAGGALRASDSASAWIDRLGPGGAVVARGTQPLVASLPPWSWCTHSPPRSSVATAAIGSGGSLLAPPSLVAEDAWAAVGQGSLGDATALLAMLWRFAGAGGALQPAPAAAGQQQRQPRLDAFLCARRVVEAAQLLTAAHPRLRSAWTALALGLGAQTLLCAGSVAMAPAGSIPREGTQGPEGWAPGAWLPAAAAVSADIVRARGHAVATAFFAAVEEAVSLRHEAGRVGAPLRRGEAARGSRLRETAAGSAPAAPASATTLEAVPRASPSAAATSAAAPFHFADTAAAAAAPSESAPTSASAPTVSGVEGASTAVAGPSTAAAREAPPDEVDDEDAAEPASAAPASRPLGIHVPDSVLLLMAARVALVCANSPGVAISYAVRASSASSRNPVRVTATLIPPSSLGPSGVGAASALVCFASRQEAKRLQRAWQVDHAVACYEVLALGLLASARGSLASAWGASFAGLAPQESLGSPTPASGGRAPGVAARVVARAVASLRRAVEILVASFRDGVASEASGLHASSATAADSSAAAREIGTPAALKQLGVSVTDVSQGAAAALESTAGGSTPVSPGGDGLTGSATGPDGIRAAAAATAAAASAADRRASVTSSSAGSSGGSGDSAESTGSSAAAADDADALSSDADDDAPDDRGSDAVSLDSLAPRDEDEECASSAASGVAGGAEAVAAAVAAAAAAAAAAARTAVGSAGDAAQAGGGMMAAMRRSGQEPPRAATGAEALAGEQACGAPASGSPEPPEDPWWATLEAVAPAFERGPCARHWPLLYHAAVGLLTLGNAPAALALARHALAASLSLQAEFGGSSSAAADAASPSDLPWAAAVLAACQVPGGGGIGAAAALLAGALRAHPRSALLRLAEARIAELLLGGEHSLVFEGAAGDGEEAEDGEGGGEAGGDNVEGGPLGAFRRSLVARPSAAAAAAASTSGSGGGWPAMACSAASGEELLQLYEGTAALADADAWALVVACASASGGDAYAAQVLLRSGGGAPPATAPAHVLAPFMTADAGGLRDALPAPAPPAPAAVRLAVAAHCHVVRVACALGDPVAASRALAAADALVDATVLPLRAVYRRQEAASAAPQALPPLPHQRAGGTGGGVSGGGGGSTASWPGCSGDPHHLSSAQREGVPTDPAIRAETLHAAGCVCEAAGDALAAQAQYAAAVAVAPSHVPSLLRLAELSLAGCATPPSMSADAAAAAAATRAELLDRAEALVDAATRAAPGHFHSLAVRAAVANLRGQPDSAVDAALGALRGRAMPALLPAELLPLRVPLWL